MTTELAEKRGWYSRGYLPHLDDLGLIQFVTFRLWDSVPLELLCAWREELEHLPKSKREQEEVSRISNYIDRGEGRCYLRIPDIAEMVQNALLHFHGSRYQLHAWTVMPNHGHVLAEIRDTVSLDQVVHSWKSYTAHRANKTLGRTGEFWFREYFDRFIRNEDHYDRVVAYIDHNPVKAKLCSSREEWRWGSARLGCASESSIPTGRRDAGAPS